MHRRRVAFWTAVAVAAIALAGCESQPPQPSRPPDQAPPAVSESDCSARIAAVDLSIEATILAVDDCRFTTAGRDASRAALEAGAEGGPLWAALWVYAASGQDPAPLRPILQVADTSARVMAASTLVALGDAAGFEPLRQSLGDETTMAGTEPPTPIVAYAVETLESYVIVEPLPADAAAWDAWVAANAGSLAFDDAAGTWGLP
jgi:hypothetical protein